MRCNAVMNKLNTSVFDQRYSRIKNRFI